MSSNADDQDQSVAVRVKADDKMTSNIKDAEQHFPFLKLSGELRNRIYDYLFDFDSISISDVHTSPYDDDEDSNEAETTDQNHIVEGRTHYTLQFHAYQGDESTELTTTYYLKGTFLDLSVTPLVSSPPPVHIHTFLVNRQFFHEARSIFYSRRFEHSESVECLLAFLQDLPQWTHEHIRSIKLLCSVDDLLNDFVFQPRFSQKAWKETCEFIQVNLNLKELQFCLFVPGLWLEKEVSNSFQGLEWIEPLIKISGLERLNIEFVCYKGLDIDDVDLQEDQYRSIEHAAESLVEHLSLRMLKEGGSLDYSYSMA
ncbi:MAG: hypothetical protein M1835_001650 [Candelina submexicana]|nr:MAG: hypothetical protein M1835_001650 [Candelina submexicana]